MIIAVNRLRLTVLLRPILKPVTSDYTILLRSIMKAVTSDYTILLRLVMKAVTSALYYYTQNAKLLSIIGCQRCHTVVMFTTLKMSQ